MSDIQMPITEADILAQVVAPGEPGLPAESARAILDLHFDQAALRRMGVLAEKNNQGILTVAESEEMEKYLRVGNFLDLMQAKARLSLKSTG
jgi:hypothetical protein